MHVFQTLPGGGLVLVNLGPEAIVLVHLEGNAPISLLGAPPRRAGEIGTPVLGHRDIVPLTMGGTVFLFVLLIAATEETIDYRKRYLYPIDREWQFLFAPIS